MMVNSTVQPVYKRELTKALIQLRKEGQRIVKDLEPHKRGQILFKAIFFPLSYLLLYALLLGAGQNLGILFFCYFFMGIFIVLNFLNLIHDAVHEVIFKSNKWLNRAYVYLFDFLGANSFIWKVRHTRLHHAFPNIMNWDSDFEQSPLVRIFPHAEAKEIHRYQHIYLPFLYPFYLINWLLVRDFKDFFKKDSIVRRVVKIPKIEYVKLFLFKGFFFFYLLILPKIVLGISWNYIILGFLLMLFTASLLSLLVLLSPHANINSEFPQADENGNLPYSWLEHQLKCTNDVTGNTFITRFFMGNFNYHIAHHLFPNVHHIYYPEITRLVKKFAEENGFPYREQSLLHSLKSHYALLKQNAYHENVFEETM